MWWHEWKRVELFIFVLLLFAVSIVYIIGIVADSAACIKMYRDDSL
jgi:hypothetical protein